MAPDPTRTLASDARSLDAIRTKASADPKAALRQVARQFESLFMQQLLKSMRDAMPRSGMFDGPGADLYTGMLDQQLAQTVAGRPGGLAEVLERQLARFVPGVDPSGGAQNGPGAAIRGSGGATSRVGPSATSAADGRGQAELARLLGDAQRLRDRLGATMSGDGPATAGPAGAIAAGRIGEAALADPRKLDFVRRMWPQAQAAEAATGVPAAFIVGQAALESGWGRSEMRLPDGGSAHNLFGIKAGSQWKGRTVEAVTTEYVDGRPVRTVEKFRAYASHAEAFADWARLMASNPRYAPVVRAASQAESAAGDYAASMQRSGYATDPAYARKLERTIEQTLAIRRLVI